MGVPDIIQDSTETDEKITSSTEETPVNDPFPGRLSIEEYSPITATRSRRPTLALVDPNIDSNLKGLPTDEIELAQQEKWTAKRILKGTWAYVTTIKAQFLSCFIAYLQGFLITVYFLNVIAWGGMLFLLLVEAAPAMCHPSCDDLYSPRKECRRPCHNCDPYEYVLMIRD
jgi:hypothetical protein